MAAVKSGKMMEPTRPHVRPISKYRFCRACSPAIDSSSSSTSSLSEKIVDPTRNPGSTISEYRFCRAKPSGSRATDRLSSSTSSPSKKTVDPTRPPGRPISEYRFCRHKPYGSPATDSSTSSTASCSRQLDPQDPSEPSKGEECRQLLRLPQDEVVFVPDYNFSVAEELIPGSELPQHISTAGMEANGTSNMKSAMNGCILIGTLDGANVQIRREVGENNLFLFGAYALEIAGPRKERAEGKFVPDLRFEEVNTFNRSGVFGPYNYDELMGSLEGNEGYGRADYSLVGKDFPSYIDCQEKIDEAHRDHKEAISDISSLENCNNLSEESGGSRFSLESQIIRSDEKTHIPEDCKRFVNGELNIDSTSLGTQFNEEGKGKDDRSSEANSSAWEPEDADAPEVLEYYKEVAESKFPIHVEEFFNMFLSDDGVRFDNGVSFEEQFRRKCNDRDLKITSWQPHEEFGHTRSVSFRHPTWTFLSGRRLGGYQEVQKYRVYRNNHLVVDTRREVSDVPFEDYHFVKLRWDVEESTDSTPGCILRVYIAVGFHKPTKWKDILARSIARENTEVFGLWIELAHELLKQKNLEKEEETIPDLEDVSQQVTDPMQGDFMKASLASFIGDVFAKFTSSSKHQRMACIFIVIAVVLVLMQISIPLLLNNRPQANLSSSMLGTGENRSEALVSVLKQMKYLKEEMRVMETLLDKLQHEHVHSLLRGLKEDLEFMPIE